MDKINELEPSKLNIKEDKVKKSKLSNLSQIMKKLLDCCKE